MGNKYYSQREGKLSPDDLLVSIEEFRRLIKTQLSEFINLGFFNESFGYMDKRNFINGTITTSWNEKAINDLLFLKVGKDYLWPIESKYNRYTEDDCFDLIEYLYTLVSEPKTIDQPFAGMTIKKLIFDTESAQKKYREEIKDILSRYEDKYDFSQDGKIEIKRSEAEKQLFTEVIVESDGTYDNNILLKSAIDRFVLSRGNENEMNESLLTLYNVFESLEGIHPEGISTDDGSLTRIINTYSIRHKNKCIAEITRKDLVYPWLFYSMLATINLKLKYIHTKNIDRN